MSKAEDLAKELYPDWKMTGVPTVDGIEESMVRIQRVAYIEGYHQAEKDLKEELSKLFREFMMDCVNDSTDTHILHFVEVFSNKIKTIGNE